MVFTTSKSGEMGMLPCMNMTLVVGPFEVVIIRVESERAKFGELSSEHEIYPTATQWGTYGWSFGPKDREIALSVAEGQGNSVKRGRITYQYPS